MTSFGLLKYLDLSAKFFPHSQKYEKKQCYISKIKESDSNFRKKSAANV